MEEWSNSALDTVLISAIRIQNIDRINQYLINILFCAEKTMLVSGIPEKRSSHCSEMPLANRDAIATREKPKEFGRVTAG
jgi:hypothetical protein